MKAIRFLILFTLIAAYTPGFSQRMISGIVKDRLGSPIHGVNVVIKGTRTGVTSDGEGKFQIKIYPDSSVLVFSFIGFLTQEQDTNGLTTINIKMKADCTSCFFDQDEVSIGLDSDVINAPLGGKVNLNIPLFFRQRMLKLGYGYKTDLGGNSQQKSEIGIGHLLYGCQYHLEVNLFYNKINIEKIGLAYKSYLAEADFYFYRNTLYAGIGNTNTSLAADLPKIQELGYLIGYGRYIAGISVSAKAIYWTEFTEYRARVERHFKALNVSLQWNHIKNYDALNAAVTFEFSYLRIFRRVNIEK